MLWFPLMLFRFVRAVGDTLRRDEEIRALATLTASLLAIGTLFYHAVEGWSLLNAFYFCVVSLATVGYGDLTPTTAVAKAFTVVYLLLGVGVLVGFLTQISDAQAQRRLDRSRRRGPTIEQALRAETAGSRWKRRPVARRLAATGAQGRVGRPTERRRPATTLVGQELTPPPRRNEPRPPSRPIDT
jgi:hypothetical protein